MLRERQWNAEKSAAAVNNKTTTTTKVGGVGGGGALKHKQTTNEDVKDGPTRPKRAALGDITEALSSTLIDSSKKTASVSSQPTAIKRLPPLVEQQEQASLLEEDPLPDYDFDKENRNDPYSVSEYAFDVFRYYKHREEMFQVGDYIRSRQHAVDAVMRVKLVNFLIEVQEGFELNHETLYLAVKLMDMYMDRVKKLDKSVAMLVAGVAIFVSAKMEERSVPTIDDLLYMMQSGDRIRYTADQMKKIERDFVRTIGYDLGAPLSYSFLRRYSRVIKLNMQVLTTGRYYLEMSLHLLDFCRISDSKLAAAALLLALRVTKTGDWNLILEKYSGYKLADVEPTMWYLNHLVHRFERIYPSAKTVVDKYSHALFFEVAKQPMLPDRFARKMTIDVPTELLFHRRCS